MLKKNILIMLSILFLLCSFAAVSTAETSGVTAVAAGWGHTVALTSDGTVAALGMPAPKDGSAHAQPMRFMSDIKGER